MQLSFLDFILSSSLPLTLTFLLVLQVNVEDRPNVEQVMEKAFFRALKKDSNWCTYVFMLVTQDYNIIIHIRYVFKNLCKNDYLLYVWSSFICVVKFLWG